MVCEISSDLYTSISSDKSMRLSVPGHCDVLARDLHFLFAVRYFLLSS